MKVLHVAMECVPFSKVGGMADVVGALPGALKRAGATARVLTPYYPQLHRGGTGEEIAAFDVHVGGVDHPVRLLDAGNRVVLLDQPTAFDRSGVYDDPHTGEGFDDQLFRCVVLCQAARIALREGYLSADIVHCHDNHTGLLPVYLSDDGGPPTVFTIHNLAYQGIFGADQFEVTGLAPTRFFGHSAFEYFGDLNLMKAGLSYAGMVTTVSPNYAAEILRPEHGHGLDGVLRWLGDRLVGILNGVDLATWSPGRDALIPKTFTAARPAGKQACTRALRKRAGLEDRPDLPLLATVSRVTAQKGLDLVGHLLPRIMRRDAQFILLGSGDPSILDLFRGGVGRWPGRIALLEGYDEELSHLVYAGSDIFCMPSRFEPCGLSQMYAMRYGSVPVVTAVGGLKDTVLPFDDDHPDGTGVLAWWASHESYMGAIDYALDLFADPAKWKAVQKNGMRRDFSWTRSAEDYVAVYKRLL